MRQHLFAHFVRWRDGTCVRQFIHIGMVVVKTAGPVLSQMFVSHDASVLGFMWAMNIQIDIIRPYPV